MEESEIAIGISCIFLCLDSLGVVASTPCDYVVHSTYHLLNYRTRFETGWHHAGAKMTERTINNGNTVDPDQNLILHE